ncbi:hypothetical protein A254_00129 [Zymomonas mobilis subsp. mobilis NRRL B-12526]|nr:hypothetical protein ZCP4_0129 [Zymomonas mobilis subsp. mobilis str. CP4 = NRRL B-14023]AHJ69770.1 hypothetical protein A254_00129 [Zymomonas mobilis subsp. mobilis NRRL B-12526]
MNILGNVKLSGQNTGQYLRKSLKIVVAVRYSVEP